MEKKQTHFSQIDLAQNSKRCSPSTPFECKEKLQNLLTKEKDQCLRSAESASIVKKIGITEELTSNRYREKDFLNYMVDTRNPIQNTLMKSDDILMYNFRDSSAKNIAVQERNIEQHQEDNLHQDKNSSTDFPIKKDSSNNRNNLKECRVKGRVIKILKDKRYGFLSYKVTPGEKNVKEIFFHFKDFVDKSRNAMVDEEVEFSIRDSKKGKEAFKVVVFENNAEIVSTSKDEERKFISTNKEARDHVEESCKSLSVPSNLLGNSVKTRLPYTGYVKCFLPETQHGYILVKGENKKDQYFTFNNVQSNLLEPICGDSVEFERHCSKKTGKTSAVRLRLQKLSKRTNEKLANYFDLLFRTLHNDASETNINNLLQAPAVWTQVMQQVVSFTGDDILLTKALNALINMNEKLFSLDERYKQIIKAIVMTKPLFSPVNGRLKSFIKNCDSIFMPTIDAFLTLVAQVMPEKIPVIINLMKPIVEKYNFTNFFFNLLKIATKSSANELADIDWSNLPLIPRNNEIFSDPFGDELNLQPVKVTGQYDNADEYMDVYFRLLRTDCFANLLTCIQNLLNGKLDMRDMNVYKNIVLAGIDISRDCLYMALKVTSYRIIKDWDTCSNLMFGNLLCLSIGGSFKDPIWFTVVNRELLTPCNIVVVQACRECNQESDGEIMMKLMTAHGCVIMVESPNYYRAYQPILQSLQALDPNIISFVEEIVEQRKDLTVQFLDERESFNGNIVYRDKPGRITLGEFWDNPYSIENSVFDESQERAVKMALRNRIGIIQGPPGSGKSFIGVKMLQLLLSVSALRSPKVLVLTYKNHALDEFLKDALKLFPNKVARVGGGSKDAKLNDISLKNLKKSAVRDYKLVDQINILKEKLEEIQDEMHQLFSQLNGLISISREAILCHFSREQILSLIQNCDWKNTKVKGLGPILFPDGYQKAKSRKGNQRVDKEEVAIILESQNKKNISCLRNAAFKKWLPNESQFLEFEKKMLGIETLDIDFEKVRESEDKVEYYEVAERDIEEVQNERMSALSQNEYRVKGELKHKLKYINYEKKEDDIRAFSDVALAKIPKLNCNILKSIADVWSLPSEQRIQLVQHIIDLQKREVTQKFYSNLKTFEELCAQKKELENLQAAHALKDVIIIGMTITGASIHQFLLKEIRPKIVIVEEAAEILEPQLIACLGTWTKYMLLVGDHFQLRPGVDSFGLKRDFNFDVSLMERLIKNNMPYETLEMQNRQREEFAVLLKDIYPNLKTNISKVEKNHPATCLNSSSFFWTHQAYEQNDRSFTNKEEAKRAVKLALFLVQQGYKPQQITILAAYRGQTKMIRDKAKEWKCTNKSIIDSLKDQNVSDADKFAKDYFKIHTIDDYQGDENDFVIVSLVRSNSKHKIGFLAERNRRCVAQSRAKCGVYFIGNGSMFLNHATWNPLIERLKEDERYGPDLLLKCKYHNDAPPFKVRNASDITLKSFCKKPCVFYMSCGRHFCERPCQPPHEHKPCIMKVSFTHKHCQHLDEKLCEEDESQKPCLKLTSFVFKSCGHHGKKRCYERVETIKCCFAVYEKSNRCHHLIEKKCSENIDEVKCKSKCSFKRDCGHTCKDHKCWQHEKMEKCETCEEIAEAKKKKQHEMEEAKRIAENESINRELKEIEDESDCVNIINLTSTGEHAREFLLCEDKVKKYIQAVHKWYPNVTKVEKVVNNELYINWLKAKLGMFDPDKSSDLKFHGTDDIGVEGITSTGFRMPEKPGMYGKGIYFATDASKSAQEIYTKGSNKLLLCDVLLGKAFTVSKGDSEMDLKKLRENECDSVFAKKDTRNEGGVLFDEFVVFNPDQAYPKYIIHYTKEDLRLTNELKDIPFKSNFSLSKHDLLPTQRMTKSDPLDMHLRIAESQFYRLMGKMNSLNVKLTLVEFYIDPVLKRNFEATESTLAIKYGANKEESKFMYVFHGTRSTKAVENIMNKNFVKSTQGKFGAGVYFSELPEYTFAYGGKNHMILSKILPGKIYPCRESGMSSRGLERGYDSHGGLPLNDGSGQYREIVIFNTDQILPCYVLHFT